MRITEALLPGLLLLAVGCEQAGATEPEATRTHALLRVERSAPATAQSEASGVAFAAVVRVPEAADPEPLLRLSAGTPALPALGQCTASDRDRSVAAVADLARAEFLDAGDVLLGTSEMLNLLAPRALPASSPSDSGKVYSSRDRAGGALPSGARYLLKLTGSDQLPSVELRVQAPDELRAVSIGGVSLDALARLGSAGDVPISWQPGESRDLVYVELRGTPDVGSLGVCSFRDADGHGALPRGLFGASGEGTIALHRLRDVVSDVAGVDGAEVRFDFALTAPVSFE